MKLQVVEIFPADHQGSIGSTWATSSLTHHFYQTANLFNVGGDITFSLQARSCHVADLAQNRPLGPDQPGALPQMQDLPVGLRDLGRPVGGGRAARQQARLQRVHGLHQGL